jgi:hypothetical protein
MYLILIPLISITYYLIPCSSETPFETLRTTFGSLWNFFGFLLSTLWQFQKYLNIIAPLSVLPYGSWIIETSPRLLSSKWSSIGSGHPWWSLCIPTKELCRYRKHRCPIPFASAILAISEVWSSVSSYLVQSHLPILPFTRFVIFYPRDLVTCCNI